MSSHFKGTFEFADAAAAASGLAGLRVTVTEAITGTGMYFPPGHWQALGRILPRLTVRKSQTVIRTIP